MEKKNISNQEALRKRVYEFYIQNKIKGKLFTVHHFREEKIAKTTIYDIIQRAENDLGYERAQGSGRKAVKMPAKKVRQLKSMFNHRSGISQRQASRKFDIQQSYVHKLLKTKSNIRVKNKTKIPGRTNAQKASARTKCSRLCSKFANHDFIVDDESYFTLSHSSINGNDHYYTDDIQACPNEVKYNTKWKFEPKVMIYIAISPKGLSKPYIKPSGLAVNQKVYLDECIKKRLMPFIKEHYKNEPYVFWPDLASAHYAKTVTSYLEEQHVKFVAKEDNPANLPETRPIEDFWGYLKGLVYKNGWNAKNVDALTNRIKYCLKKVDPQAIQALGSSTFARLDKIRRKDIVENRL